MDNPSRSWLSVKDVYGLAKDIASDFEGIASIYGCDILQSVVLKVIDGLERLEESVIRLESVERDLQDLRLENALLRSERRASISKLDLDVEEVEGAWQEEIGSLRLSIFKLQEENRLLQHLLTETLKSQTQKGDGSEHLLVQQLQEAVQSLTAQLKERSDLVQSHISHIINLKASLEKEKSASTILHQKIKDCEELICKFWGEKTDLQHEVAQQRHVLEQLHQDLKEISEQKSYFEEALISSKQAQAELCEETLSLQLNAEDYLKNLLQERDSLLVKISDLKHQLLTSKRETEEYRQKYLASCDASKPGSLQSTRGIRQLFRLFLELVVVDQAAFYI